MPEAVLLTPIEPSEGIATLVQGSSNPVFRGTEPDGIRYACGVCKTRVLVEDAAPGDLYDVAFRCGACGGLSMSPRLPAGHPLSWQRTVVLEPGQYMIKGTVEGQVGVVLAGREAVERILRETGTSTAIDLGETQLSSDYLESFVSRAKALLGEAYAEMKASYDRGQRSHTPPRITHRLMELVYAAEAAAASFRASQPAIDPVATVELYMTLGQLGRWSNHPTWPSILKSLKSPQDFPHIVATLAAASFLTDAGNAVELVPVGGGPTPDLRLHLGSERPVGTEVKVPRDLQRPRVPLDGPTARSVVRSALHRAGSGESGQLSPAGDALLVLGGFGLRVTDLNNLEAAALNAMRRYPNKRPHLMGIAIVSLGVLIDAGPAAAGFGHPMPRLSAILTARIATNENYSGVNRLSQEERPGLHPVTETLEEMELGAGAAFRIAPLQLEDKISPESPQKLGRNDPCWCGSGKKYKKCHGR